MTKDEFDRLLEIERVPDDLKETREKILNGTYPKHSSRGSTMQLNTEQLRAALPLVRAAFPEYKGRKVSLTVSDTALDLRSYWSGGHRDYWKAVELSTGAAIAVPQNGTPFDGALSQGIRYEPRKGVAIVRLTFSGSSKFAGIYLHPSDAVNSLITG